MGILLLLYSISTITGLVGLFDATLEGNATKIEEKQDELIQNTTESLAPQIMIVLFFSIIIAFLRAFN